MTNKVVEINPPKTGTGARTILTPKEPLTHQNCKKIEALFSEAMNQQKTDHPRLQGCTFHRQCWPGTVGRNKQKAASTGRYIEDDRLE